MYVRFVAVLLFCFASISCSTSTQRSESRVGFDDSELLSDVDLNSAIRDCLVEAGFEVELDVADPFGPSIYVPPQPTPEADRLLAVAKDDCEDRLVAGGSMRPTMLPTEEELIEQYEFLLGARGCLLDLGYQIAPAPTLGSYLTNGGQWLPHDDLEPQIGTFEDLETAYRSCPQVPRRD